MKVCLVTGGTYEDFVLNKLHSLKDADLIAFAFGVCRDEGAAEELRILSKDLSCAVFAGLVRKDNGRSYRYTAAFDGGKELGSADMTHSLNELPYELGNTYRVFDASAGKIGALTDTDIFFSETPRILALSGAEILLCLQAAAAPLCLFKSACLCNGLTGILAANGYSAVSDASGIIAYSSGDMYPVLSFDPLLDKTLLKARRSDIYSLIKHQ